jgi:hypothetical protein
MRATPFPGLWQRWCDDESFKDWEHQGAFDFFTEPKTGQQRFVFVCPGACKSIAFIAVRPVVDGSPQSWERSGTAEAPTLRPSIHHVGCWHGWLTDGVFAAC